MLIANCCSRATLTNISNFTMDNLSIYFSGALPVYIIDKSGQWHLEVLVVLLLYGNGPSLPLSNSYFKGEGDYLQLLDFGYLLLYSL